MPSSSPQPITGVRRWAIYIIGVIETFTFGGCIMGWGQLVYVLKKEGVFMNLCQDYSAQNQTLNQTLSASFDSTKSQEIVGCEEQDKRFALIYAIASLSFGTPGVLIGLMLHHCGLAISRIMASLLITTGFLALGFTTKESSEYIYLAMISIAIGGNQIRMSVMPFGNMFPELRSTAMTVMSGSVAASAGLFLVFQVGQEFGLSLFAMSLGFAAFAFMSIPATFIMPWHHIPFEKPNEDKLAQGSKIEGLPLSTSVISISFFTHLLWVFVNGTIISYYSAQFNSWISSISQTNEEAGFYSLLYSTSSFACALVTPLPGLITDYFIKHGIEGANPEERFQKRLKGSIVPMLGVFCLSGIILTCMFFHHAAAIYISLVAMVIMRPSTIGVGVDFQRIRFPDDHFSRMVGIFSTVKSLLKIVQYPLFIWAQINSRDAMSFCLFVLTLTLSNPLHMFSKRYRKKVTKSIFKIRGPEEEKIIIGEKDSNL